MKLGDMLDEILQEWLDSPDHGEKVQELYGIDGYVCICNFVEYVKEKEHEYREPDSDGY